MHLGPAVLVLAAALTAGPAPQRDLADLAFMSGCWRGPIEGGFMEEIYTDPADNLMLGTTRYVRGTRVASFELTRIERRDDGVFLVPYPNGDRSSAEFRLTRTTDGEALFEAPEHDFPRRIRYARQPDGTLRARIDDGSDDGQAMEWTLSPADCPGASS